MISKPTFKVIGAVKDLNDLYSRINPRGPYRISLFSDVAEVGAEWPPPFRDHGERIDCLIRGVGCLLANDLMDSAWPVAAELWNSVVCLERELAADNWREPEYYSFLSRELSVAQSTGDQIYRLFGEVLAIYLDIICSIRVDYRRQYGEQINRLRQLIVQTGESSSSSTICEG